MCNETVRGLDSLEGCRDKTFCAEVISSNVDDLFSPLDLNKAEAESTVPEPKLTHGVAGLAFERENRLKSSKKKSEHELLKHAVDKQLARV